MTMKKVTIIKAKINLKFLNKIVTKRSLKIPVLMTQLFNKKRFKFKIMQMSLNNKINRSK